MPQLLNYTQCNSNHSGIVAGYTMYQKQATSNHGYTLPVVGIQNSMT